MRTILIPLLLICSLTQFESVQAEKKNRSPHTECGGDTALYYCFAPEICTGPEAIENAHWQEHSVVEVKHDTLVTDDCPAFFRYHMNAIYSMRATIESFQEANTITSVEFSMLRPSTATTLHKFSCKIETDRIIGSYGDFEKTRDDEIPQKLKCVFEEIRTESKKQPMIDNPMTNDRILFTINGLPTKDTVYRASGSHSKFFCDPNDLQFYKVDDADAKQDKLYDKIHYEPGKYECKKFYEFEYRDAGDPVYTTGQTLACPAEKFRFGNTEKNPGTIMDVRCAADVKFFCDYDVLAKPGEDENRPILTHPVWEGEQKMETKLECPPEKPILNIVRENVETSVLKPSIKCQKFGSMQFWVVDGQKLTDLGPPVYCSATVKCDRQFRLSNSQVKNGILDSNYLPECAPGGTLRAGDREVLDKGCNEKTGKFFYTVDAGQPVDFDTTTEFVCKFELLDNVEQNKADEKFVWTGIGIAGGAAAVLIFAFIVALVFGSRYLNRRKRLKEGAKYNANYERFGVTREERNRLEKEKRTKRVEEMNRLNNQNRLMKYIRRKELRALTAKVVYDKAHPLKNADGELPSVPQEFQQGIKWTPWNVDRMLRARKIHIAREGKMPIPASKLTNDLNDLKAKATTTMKSMDKTVDPAKKVVVKESSFMQDQKLRRPKRLMLGLTQEQKDEIEKKKKEKEDKKLKKGKKENTEKKGKQEKKEKKNKPKN